MILGQISIHLLDLLPKERGGKGWGRRRRKEKKLKRHFIPRGKAKQTTDKETNKYYSRKGCSACFPVTLWPPAAQSFPAPSRLGAAQQWEPWAARGLLPTVVLQHQEASAAPTQGRWGWGRVTPGSASTNPINPRCERQRTEGGEEEGRRRSWKHRREEHRPSSRHCNLFYD